MDKKSFNFKEFWEELKKDKKKMFFAIFIPFILIISIIFGIIFKDKNEVPPSDQDQISTEGLIVPVDTISLQNDKSKSKTQVYRKDFFALEEQKEEAELFEGNLNKQESNVAEKPNSAPRTSPSKSSYSYKSPYESISSDVPSKTSSSPVKESDGEAPKTADSDSRRRRTPSDNYGNMTAKRSVAKDMYSAVVANENKLVKNGSHVKIRIGEDIMVDGLKLPKNSIITGTTQVQRERMVINITSVRIEKETKQVKWVVYDQDGNEGIAIPPSILNNIARDAAGDAIDKSGAKVETNVPVIGSVKLNLKQKNQEVEFVLTSGHKVYIKEKR